MTNQALLALALAACTNGTTGTGITPDGRPADPRGVTTLECSTSKFALTASDGSRTETLTYFATVDGIQPGDSFAIESCDFTTLTFPPTNVGACPSGYTCATTGDPYPTGPACTWTTTGQFIGNTLTISCGNRTSNFSASGSTLSYRDSRYTTIRVHR